MKAFGAAPLTPQITLSATNQGTDGHERNGDRIKIKSIRFNFNIHTPGTETVAHVYRIIIMRINETRGALPDLKDYYNFVDYNNIRALKMLPQGTGSTGKKGKVMYDRTRVMPAGGGHSTNHLFSANVYPKGYTTYVGNTNAITDSQRNSYFLWYISDDSSPTDATAMLVRYNGLMRFVDE